MAAPQVAAAAAMVRHLNPDLSAADIIELIKRTARRAGGGGWNAELGWGILDAGAAIAAARQEDRRPPTSRLTTSHRLRRGKITLRLTGSDKAPAGVVASGIARFEIWRSLNGGRARKLRSTRARVVHVVAHRGARYGFYSIAVDKAGNRESAPGRADARFTLR
jgi:hypothetical protein